MTGIYKIQSTVKPERIYVGSAVNIGRRWNEHLYDLKHNRHQNKKLQNHFNKHGETDLTFTILLGCENTDLLKIEQYFLDSYKTYFNIRKDAISCLGCRQSKESNRKRSETLKRIWKDKVMSETERRNRSESHRGVNNALGKKWSEESKEKVRGRKHPWCTGNVKGMTHPHSEESKQKMRETALKREPMSEETRNKISQTLTGKKIPEGVRLKMSMSHKGRTAHNKGIPWTDEFRENMMNARKIKKEFAVNISMN